MPNPLWTTSSPPASGLIVWLKQDPLDGTDGRRPGLGGKAGPAGAGKGKRFGENKTEGGAREEVSGKGRRKAFAERV